MADGVKFNISLDAANYSAGVAKVIQMNKRIADSAKDAGHATVSSMQASSAAIRSLENPLGNNLRAVERFISTIPGVGTALKAAFPIVGALAFASIIAGTTDKVIKFVKEINEMPQAISNGFRELNGSAQLANDELALTNDTLRNHIALMSGKPQNNVALALDEARVAADKLAASLRKDQQEIASLLKDKSIGLGGQLLGKGATGIVEGSIKYGEQELSDLGQAYDDAVRTGDSAKIAATTKALKDKQDYYITWSRSQEAMRRNAAYTTNTSGQATSYANVYGDQSTNLNILAGFAGSIKMRQDSQQMENDHATLTATDKRMQGAKEAASKAAEALRKAQELVVRQMEDYHAKFDDEKARSAQDEMDYWGVQAAQMSAGGAKAAKALEEATKKLSELRHSMTNYTARELDEQAKLLAKLVPGADEQDLSRNSSTIEQLAAQSRTTVENLKIMRDTITLTREFNDASREQATAQKASTGALNAHDAAIQRATNHEAAYLALMEELKSTGATADTLQKAQDQYSLQSSGDKAAIYSTTMAGQWQTALNEMTNEFTDFSQGLIGIFKSGLSGVNNELTTLLTTRYHNGYDTTQAFRAVGHTVFSGVANAGIQGVEGLGLKALGFGSNGKLGTQSNPMYVRMADALGTATTGIGGWFSRLFSSNSASTATPGTIPTGPVVGLDQLASGALSALPFLAGGGPLDGGSPAVIGESGPELWIPKTSGTVLPNSVFTGGDTHYHAHIGNIDASGSQHPSVTHQQVYAAVVAGMQQSQKSTLKAVREHGLRRPSSAGR